MSRTYETPDAVALAQYVAQIFDDPSGPRVPELVGAGRDSLTGTPLWRLAMTSPALVPTDLVRVLARSANAGVSDAAVQILGILHEAEDAEHVLAHHLARGVMMSFHKTQDVLWLAGLAASERLVPLLEPRSLFELARRRRCAGMGTALREQARRLLEMERAEEWVARIAFELDDAELAAELARHRPAKMIEQWTTPPASIATADLRFLANELDDANYVDGSAYAAYAYVLRADPDNAYAALQLAWIDRAFGTPIGAARIAWLRALGVRDDELLDELALPTPPIAGARVRRYKDPSEAERTLLRTQHARALAATGNARVPPGS